MSMRVVARRLGVLVAIALLLGAACAAAWAGLTVLPSFVVQADGHATISQVGLAHVVSADWWFSVLAFAGGLALGVAAWVSLRSIGWPVAVVAAGLALIAGATCWLVGELIGPNDFATRMAAGRPGDLVPIALKLRAPAALEASAAAMLAPRR